MTTVAQGVQKWKFLQMTFVEKQSAAADRSPSDFGAAPTEICEGNQLRRQLQVPPAVMQQSQRQQYSRRVQDRVSDKGTGRIGANGRGGGGSGDEGSEGGGSRGGGSGGGGEGSGGGGGGIRGSGGGGNGSGGSGAGGSAGSGAGRSGGSGGKGSGGSGGSGAGGSDSAEDLCLVCDRLLCAAGGRATGGVDLDDLGSDVDDLESGAAASAEVRWRKVPCDCYSRYLHLSCLEASFDEDSVYKGGRRRLVIGCRVCGAKLVVRRQRGRRTCDRRAWLAFGRHLACAGVVAGLLLAFGAWSIAESDRGPTLVNVGLLVLGNLVLATFAFLEIRQLCARFEFTFDKLGGNSHHGNHSNHSNHVNNGLNKPGQTRDSAQKHHVMSNNSNNSHGNNSHENHDNSSHSSHGNHSNEKHGSSSHSSHGNNSHGNRSHENHGNSSRDNHGNHGNNYSHSNCHKKNGNSSQNNHRNNRHDKHVTSSNSDLRNDTDNFDNCCVEVEGRKRKFTVTAVPCFVQADQELGTVNRAFEAPDA